MSDTNTQLTTLADWRRAAVGAMRTNPKVDRAIRKACANLYAEGLQDMTHRELREALVDLYLGNTNAFHDLKRRSCVAVFDELAALHCIDSEEDFGNDGALFVELLTGCGVRS